MVIEQADSPQEEGRPAGYGEAFSRYVAAGWRSVLPLPRGAKHPPPVGFTGSEARYPTQEEMEAWGREFPAGNVCLKLPPTVVVLDSDHYGEKRGGDTIAQAEERWGHCPAPMSTAHGRHPRVTTSSESPRG